MMDVTDRHYRALARLISRHATLYTEMVVDRTIIHNPKLRLLELRIPNYPQQHPVILQLGGSDPDLMTQAAEIAADYPYQEINVNCGCPSPKVADNGCFGAALMKSPILVAQIVSSMSAVVKDIPITVKCRLGLEWDADLAFVKNFIKTIHQHAGVTHFIIHARNAILGGLSPAQNRSVPPLRHNDVYHLIDEFPYLNFSINGGIRSIDDVVAHLNRGAYGVMVGRAAMDAPWQALSQVDSKIYNSPNTQVDGCVTTRRHILRDYVEYANNEIAETNCSVRTVIKPLLNLFHGERNGKLWRRSIDEGLRDNLSFEMIVGMAMQVVPSEVLDAAPGQKPVFPPKLVRQIDAAGDESHGDVKVTIDQVGRTAMRVDEVR